jgi:hypothetical protein
MLSRNLTKFFGITHYKDVKEYVLIPKAAKKEKKDKKGR